MSLLALLAALVGGVALSLFLDPEDAPLHVRLAQGTVFGLVLLALCGYPLAAFLGMRPSSVGLGALLALLPACFQPKARWRALRPGRPSTGGLLYAAAVGGLLLAFFDRVFLETASGLSTGVDHNIADLPFHISIVQGFVLGDNFPPRHPELAAARLTYPFLADFGVAQLVALGMTLRQAVTLQNAALSLALFALLHRFALQTTGDRLAARLTPPLVFLSGGFGFALLFGSQVGSPFALETLRRLPFNVTMLPDGPVRFGNALTTLLASQRALLMGAPLALVAFTLLWRACRNEGAARRGALMGAALVTGLLPLVHVHSAAVVLAVGAALALLDREPSAWLKPGLLATALVAPQALWLLASSSMRAGSFLAWHLGWEAGQRNWIVFWLWNAGLFLPVLLFGTRLAPPELRRFHLPFWALFVVPNLLRLSPWIWDNMKFLFFWLLGSAPLVALAVARLSRTGSPLCFTAAPLFLLLVLSGGLDVGRVITRQIDLGVFGPERVALAAAIAGATPPRAVLLRAPIHDSPVLLAGRLSVLGYPGHIWSQGFEEGDLQPAIARIYAGAPDARALLDRLGVDFILVGPDERRMFAVNDGFLSSFPAALETRGAVLRRVR